MNIIHAHSTSTEERVLSALAGAGPQTLEDLTEVSGLSWSQMFLAIDRLSRTGDIVLQPTWDRGYQVSLKAGR